jgi:integrase
MDKVVFGDTALKLIATYTGPDHSLVTRCHFWIAQLGHKPWLDITPEDIERALSVYMAAGKSKVIRSGRPPNVTRRVVATGEPHAPATINKLLMAFPTLVKMAKERYLLPRSYQSPTKFVTKQREDNARYIEITRAEIDRLILVAGLARWKPLPAIIATAASTGLRLGNLRKLKWSDINFDKKLVSVPTSKNGSAYSCALSNSAIEHLHKIKRAHCKPSDLVFGNHHFVRSYKSAVKDAGLEGKLTCFHLLRHVAASLLSQANASELTVMSQLGQKSPSMARRYSHLSNQHLVDAVGRAWSH